MEILPILSTLRRHRTAATLIVLQVALTCAIVCNAVFLIGDRLERMHKPSGLVESELVRVQLSGIGTTADADAVTAQDLAALRAIAGVKAVTVANQVPFGNSSWNTDASLVPDHAGRGVNGALYLGTEDLLPTFGLQLIAGRNFNAGECMPGADVRTEKAVVPSAILTRGLAERLFPDGSAIGKKVYITGKDPQIVVGVVERLARPNDSNGAELSEFAMIIPVKQAYTQSGTYVLRVDPARRDEVLAQVDATLLKVSPSRIIIDHGSMEELRTKYFRADRAMARLLIGVCVALLLITGLGIIGLASFWVQQRTRQIGVRRALGATRGDIRRYFQTENFILATIGIVLGMALAYAINLWLMHKYAVGRLPAEFLPVGALLLWALGQAAVLGPAMRGAAIPPAIATRSV